MCQWANGLIWEAPSNSPFEGGRGMFLLDEQTTNKFILRRKFIYIKEKIKLHQEVNKITPRENKITSDENLVISGVSEITSGENKGYIVTRLQSYKSTINKQIII